jgi:hypothetical protein
VWRNLVAFNRTAGIIRDYVRKGSQLLIEVKIQNHWTCPFWCPSPLPEHPRASPLNPYSSQEKDHGGREKGNPHLMKGIPLSKFPLCTVRESIRIHSDHTVVDWYQGQ